MYYPSPSPRMLGVRLNNQLALQLGAKFDEKGLALAHASGESRSNH